MPSDHCPHPSYEPYEDEPLRAILATLAEQDAAAEREAPLSSLPPPAPEQLTVCERRSARGA